MYVVLFDLHTTIYIYCYYKIKRFSSITIKSTQQDIKYFLNYFAIIFAHIKIILYLCTKIN